MTTIPRPNCDARMAYSETSMARVHFTPFRFIAGHRAAERVEMGSTTSSSVPLAAQFIIQCFLRIKDSALEIPQAE